MREGCIGVPVTRTLASERRAMLPFLPTLATALAVAAASLLCRPPASPIVQPGPAIETARAGAVGLYAAQLPSPQETVPALSVAEIVPAALAFGRLTPPAFVTDAAVKPAAAAVRPARPAAQPTIAAIASPAAAIRRSCPGTGASLSSPRCTETRRGDPVHATASHPVRPMPEPASAASVIQPLPAASDPLEQDELPRDALPYAATAASWFDEIGRFGARVGRSVGQEAVTAGSSVVELLASAR